MSARLGIRALRPRFGPGLGAFKNSIACPSARRLYSPSPSSQVTSTAAIITTAATTAATAPTPPPLPKLSPSSKSKSKSSAKSSILVTLALGITGAGLYYVTDTRATTLHHHLSVPLVRLLFPDAEDSHHAAVDALRSLYQLGLNPRERPNLGQNPISLQMSGLFDSSPNHYHHGVLDNPIGISAGLDKNGDIPDPLFDLGAAVVEIGGITPVPQIGNPRPRVFRLPSQNAAINRYGLNSDGADVVAERLHNRVKTFAATKLGWSGPDAVQAVLDGHAEVPPGSLRPGKILAVQIAKAKGTPENDIQAVCRDYVTCVEKLGPYADVLVVNVSSPNTPGLRALQNSGPLTELLSAVVAAAEAIPRHTKPAVMVKVSPDEDSPEQIAGVCDAVYLAKVDGLIVGNTTKTRPVDGNTISARDGAVLAESGGYSGPLMFPHTLKLIRRYRHTLDNTPLRLLAEAEADAEANSSNANFKDGDDANSSSHITSIISPAAAATQQEKVIFASGGITSGNDVLQALNAGASVCMMYTALTMNGLGHVTTVKTQVQNAIASPTPSSPKIKKST